jgi:hypothetical protein
MDVWFTRFEREQLSHTDHGGALFERSKTTKYFADQSSSPVAVKAALTAESQRLGG